MIIFTLYPKEKTCYAFVVSSLVAVGSTNASFQAMFGLNIIVTKA
jgi:hypothetical protein